MNLKDIKPGEVLYFQPEDMTIVVVIVGKDGFRYICPPHLQFDDDGNLISTYVSYEALSEWTISLGTISDISASLIGKKTLG